MEQLTIDVIFYLDFSKWNWNLRFNSNNTVPLMKWLDGFFGLDGVHDFTHEFFDRDNPSGLGTVYHFHLGGIEGLRQKGWTTATFAVILEVCDRLRWRASLTGEGDNQAVIALHHTSRRCAAANSSWARTQNSSLIP